MAFAMRNSLRRFTLFAASTWLLAIGLACTVEDGDRAATGACPAGETCSPIAPSGLRFIGPFLGGTASDRLGPTATGGTQTITVVGLEAGTPATLETTSYWHLLLSTLAEDQTFVVDGVSPGDTPITVRDADGLLLDRVSLRTARIARIDVVRSGGDENVTVLDRGVRASLVVRLFSEDGERIVDEDLSVEVTAGASLVPVSWDCFDLELPSGAAETIQLEIRTGDRVLRQVAIAVAE